MRKHSPPPVPPQRLQFLPWEARTLLDIVGEDNADGILESIIPEVNIDYNDESTQQTMGRSKTAGSCQNSVNNADN